MDLIFFGLFLILAVVFYFICFLFNSDLFMLAGAIILLVLGITILGTLGHGNICYNQPVNITISYSPDYFVYSNSTPLMTGDVIENTTYNGNSTQTQGFTQTCLLSTEQQLAGYVLLLIGLGTMISAYLGWKQHGT